MKRMLMNEEEGKEAESTKAMERKSKKTKT